MCDMNTETCVSAGQFAAELLEDADEHRHEEGDERHHHADARR